MHLKEIRNKKGVSASQLASAIGTDRFMVSKFENCVCLPTPIIMQRICKFLDCDILDIWDKTEIYIKPRNLASERRNELNRRKYYQFGCRVPKDCCNILKLDKLLKLGYTSKKNWLIKQINDFALEFEQFEKKYNKRR